MPGRFVLAAGVLDRLTQPAKTAEHLLGHAGFGCCQQFTAVLGKLVHDHHHPAKTQLLI